MNLRKIKKTIYKYWTEYNSEYFKIPQIDNIELVNLGSWGHFDSDVTFNRQYILKVDPELFDQNENFIKQILYHEFTHMYDSTIFYGYDKNSFKKIMQIYSEVHASEIQMDILLSTQNVPYNLDKSVIHRGELTLRSYMDQTLKHIIDEFTPPSGKITQSNLKFDFKELYYFIGNLLSLKKNGIQYNFEYTDIPTEFIVIFEKITAYFLNNTEYNHDLLLSLQENLSNTIKDYIATHNNSIAEHFLENADINDILQALLQDHQNN